MLWPEEYVNVRMREHVENPVMTFLIKKRINTEPSIDRTAAFYKEETLIRVVTKDGDHKVGTNCKEGQLYLMQSAILISKGEEMKDQV